MLPKERNLEESIENYLVSTGYEQGHSQEFDLQYCLFTEDLFRFLENSFGNIAFFFDVIITASVSDIPKFSLPSFNTFTSSPSISSLFHIAASTSLFFMAFLREL